ncbi:helix-turn-helix domain-containing protein [Cerasicoccus maritimus]|uniref:helix-turn-helix domain-containing protein n=1 Tax=Cerasicoccus maritimus TaxID=490089 RepID=UPI002852CBAB|nr:helix-turn-helix transcriptional regulator [Cerasicoccus maritimus]
MEDYHYKLAERLKSLRLSAKLTQEGVAEMASLSYKHYQSLEAGRKKDVKLSSLVQLARAFELEPWELLYPDQPVLSPSFLRRVQRFASKRTKS